jgi:hypothetical protein
MVDSSKLTEQTHKDSLDRIKNTLRDGVVAAIRNYTSAIQRGDITGARAAFPSVPVEELARWQSTLEKYDVRLRVVPPRQVILSNSDLVADADVTLVVTLLDRTTKAEISTNSLPRHATLTKQRQRWQLDSFKAR